MNSEKAKEHLMQIRTLQVKIDQRREQLESIRESAASISANVEGERVQSSSNGSKVENAIVQCIELEEQITQMICNMESKKNNVIGMIQMLTDERYVRILVDHYVNGLSLCEIAVKMNYEYKWLCRLHGYALVEFSKILDNKIKQDKTRFGMW